MTRNAVAGTAEGARRADLRIVGGSPAVAVEREPARDTPDLAPCGHCGAPNGRSASTCWQCESALTSVVPLRAPSRDATTTARRAPARHAVRRLPAIVAMFVLTAMVGSSAYMLLRPPPPVEAGKGLPALGATARLSTGAIEPAPATPTVVPVRARTETAVDAMPPSATLPATPARAARTPPAAARPHRPAAAAPRPMRADRAGEATPLVRAAREPGADPPARGPSVPCTTAVAALGLCATSPVPPKE